jgi:hypothetical protein
MGLGLDYVACLLIATTAQISRTISLGKKLMRVIELSVSAWLLAMAFLSSKFASELMAFIPNN